MESQTLSLLYVFVSLTILLLCLLGMYAVGRLRETGEAPDSMGLHLASWLFLASGAVVLLAVRVLVGRLGLEPLFNGWMFDAATGFLVLVLLCLGLSEGRYLVGRKRQERRRPA